MSPKFKILRELAIIVFGVILGLWLSDLLANQNEQAFTDKTIEVMLQELDKNYDEIIKAREYHLTLLPKLVEARNAERKGESPNENFEYRGFGTPPTTSAAYKTALSTGIFAQVDPSYASSLATAYESIESMKETYSRYKLALANSQKSFLEITPLAFGDLLYADDIALAEIAALIEKKAPAPWYTIIDVQPY